MSRPPVPGTPPTDRQLEALALQLVLGGKEAAHRRGVSYQTHKNHIGMVLGKLEVSSAPEAATALKWLRIPARYLIQDDPIEALP